MPKYKLVQQGYINCVFECEAEDEEEAYVKWKDTPFDETVDDIDMYYSEWEEVE